MKKLSFVIALVMSLSLLICSLAMAETTTAFSYEGTYTYTGEDGTVYEMLVLANTDYEMKVIKDFGEYKAIKYYLGPLKDINDNSMAQMPVFLGDFYYEGEGAPDKEEAEELLDGLVEKFQNAKAALGEGEEPKFFYITLNKDNWTFEPDVAKNEEKGLKSSLDYISNIWTEEDLAAAE